MEKCTAHVFFMVSYGVSRVGVWNSLNPSRIASIVLFTLACAALGLQFFQLKSDAVYFVECLCIYALSVASTLTPAAPAIIVFGCLGGVGLYFARATKYILFYHETIMWAALTVATYSDADASMGMITFTSLALLAFVLFFILEHSKAKNPKAQAVTPLRSAGSHTALNQEAVV